MLPIEAYSVDANTLDMSEIYLISTIRPAPGKEKEV